jgi:hypothetical protein
MLCKNCHRPIKNVRKLIKQGKIMITTEWRHVYDYESGYGKNWCGMPCMRPEPDLKIAGMLRELDEKKLRGE